MKTSRLLLLSLVCLLSIPAVRAESPEAVSMNPPEDYPGAGLRMAIPGGFRIHPVSNPNQVLLATRIEGRKATQSISVFAYLVEDPEATAESFSAKLFEPLKESLAFRNLKVVKTGKMPLAGLEGFARRMTYRHRGQDTVAVSACVIRNVQRAAKNGQARKPSPLRIAYILGMEVARDKEGKQADRLLRTFDAVSRAMSFIGLQHPANLPLELKDRPFVKNFRKGLAMRQPAHWAAAVTKNGLSMGATDYLLHGAFTPAVQVLALQTPKGLTAKACGLKYIEHQRKEGTTVKILAEAKAPLAGKQGYQYVLQRTLPPASRPASAPAEEAAELDRDVIEIQRGLCLPGKHGSDACRHVVLLLTCRYCDRKRAENIMNELAKNFSLLTPVK